MFSALSNLSIASSTESQLGHPVVNCVFQLFYLVTIFTILCIFALLGPFGFSFSGVASVHLIDLLA